MATSDSHLGPLHPTNVNRWNDWSPSDYATVVRFLRAQGVPPSEEWLRTHAPTLYPHQEWPAVTWLDVDLSEVARALPFLTSPDGRRRVPAQLIEFARDFSDTTLPVLSVERIISSIESRAASLPHLQLRLIPHFRNLQRVIDPSPQPTLIHANQAAIEPHLTALRREWQSHLFPEKLSEFCRDLADEIELEGKILTHWHNQYSNLGLWKDLLLAHEIGWGFQRSLWTRCQASKRSVAWAINLTRAYTSPVEFVSHSLHPVYSRKSYGANTALELFSIGEFEAVVDAILNGLRALGPTSQWPATVIEEVGFLVAVAPPEANAVENLSRAAVRGEDAPYWLHDVVTTAFVDYLWSAGRLSQASVDQLVRGGNASNNIMDDMFSYRANVYERRGLAVLLHSMLSAQSAQFSYSDPRARVPSYSMDDIWLPKGWRMRIPRGLTDELLAVVRLLGSVMWTEQDDLREKGKLTDGPAFQGAAAVLHNIKLREFSAVPEPLKFQLGRLDGKRYSTRLRTIRTAAPLAFPSLMKIYGDPLFEMNSELWRWLYDETSAVRLHAYGGYRANERGMSASFEVSESG